MKCSNCGAELPEGEKFCAVCGQQTESEENMKQRESVPGSEEKHGKSRGFKIGIVAAVVAVLVVGTIAGAKVINMMKKANMSPVEYYQYVETKSRDNGEKLFVNYYDHVRESFAGNSYAKEINMKLEASDTAKSLLSLTGIDVSKVRNLEVNMVTGKEGKEYSNLMKLRGNDSDLLTLKTFMDVENKKAYYQIPEFSEAYLDMSSMLGDGAAYQDMTSGLDEGTAEAGSEEEEQSSSLPYSSMLSMYDLDNILVKTDDLKNIYERYTDLLIKSAKNVKKSEEDRECEAEGVSQKADQYTVTMDGKELAALMKKLMETLKSDDTLKGIIENIDKDAYEEFTSNLESGISSIDGTGTDGINAVMDVQIDGSDRIIGRRIVITSEEGSDAGEFVLDMRFPKDGDNFGMAIVVESDGEEVMALHGKGTEKAGVINGEFTLDTDGSLNKTGNSLLSAGKLLVVTLEDYDMSKYAEGKVSGTVTYSTEAVAALANYSLKVESEGDMKQTSGKISILAGKDALVTIDVTMKSDVKAESVKPSAGDKVYDMANSSDMLAYQSDMDIMGLLGDVQEKLEIDLSGLIARMLGSSLSDPMNDYGDLDLDEFAE